MNIKLNGYNLLTSESCRIYLHFSVTFQWLLIKIITYKLYFSSVYTFIFYFFHSILLCLTWYICPSLAWQEESRFSLLVNQVRFISISVLIVRDASFLFWYIISVWPYTTYFCQIQKITTSLTLSLPWVTRT